jgi:hypothetical protein
MFCRRARYHQQVMSTGASFRRSAVGVTIALTSVMMLTGCLGAKVAIPTNTPAPVVTVTVTPTPEPVPTVTVTPEPEAVPVEPPPVEPPAEEILPPEEEVVITLPTDNGVIPRATGSVQIDSEGIPYRYTVAAGDVAVEICTRFNRYIWQLTDNNGVTLDNPFLLHAGDIILLTANEMPDGYEIPSQ